MSMRRLSRFGMGGLLLFMIVAFAFFARSEASSQSKPTLTLSSAQHAAGVTESQRIVFAFTADRTPNEDDRVFAVSKTGGDFIGGVAAGHVATIRRGASSSAATGAATFMLHASAALIRQPKWG